MWCEYPANYVDSFVDSYCGEFPSYVYMDCLTSTHEGICLLTAPKMDQLDSSQHLLFLAGYRSRDVLTVVSECAEDWSRGVVSTGPLVATLHSHISALGRYALFHI